MNPKLVKAAFCLLMAGSALSQATNTIAPSNVVIDCTNGFRLEGNKAVWRGNIRVSDREMELMCELLTLYFHTNQGNRLDTIIAETNVLIVQKDSWAHGDRAVYTASNDVMVLSAIKGEVLLDNPDFYLMGPTVVFDRKTGKFNAPGAITMGGSTQSGVFGTNSLGFSLPGGRGTNALRPQPGPPPRRTFP